MPDVSMDVDKRHLEEAADLMATRRMEAMGLKRPSAPETPANVPGGMDTQAAQDSTTPTSQGPSSGVSEGSQGSSSTGMGPGSASSDLADRL